MIRLLIAASSPMVRAGLESLAASSPQIKLVGVYSDLSAADELRPDVVLAALDPDEITPAPAIVMLASDAAAPWTVELFRSGVRAVLPETAGPAEILAAIDAVAAGLSVLDPQDLESLLATGARAQPVSVEALTPRELEVLRMLAEGAANKTIAWKLAISEHTVKFHVASILAKLNANSRTEAVTTGIRQGLIMV